MNECDESWAFDVTFDAYCNLPAGHTGEHYAEVIGNGGVVAEIEWLTPLPPHK